jgi:hypothetical protein
VFGTGASTASASATVTGITTTGVVAGDLLWVQSSSGRQFSIIASVDSGTQVTCDDAFSNTESGRTWAIGGKRATFNATTSRTLFSATGAKTGWTIETETDQTIDSSIVMAAAALEAIVVRGDSPASRRTITQSANTSHFNCTVAFGWVLFENLVFVNTNGTKTSANCFVNGSSVVWSVSCKNCIFGDATNKLRSVVSNTNGSAQFRMRNCLVRNCTGNAFSSFFTNGMLQFYHCRFTSNEATVINNTTTGGTTGLLVEGCIFSDNTGDVISLSASHAGTMPPPTIRNSIFHNNSGDGLSLVDTAARRAVIEYNIFTNNTYGIDVSATILGNNGFIDYNVFGSGAFANTSGERRNISAGPNDISVADPFEDSAAGDFNINNDAGGGADLRAATVVLP